ncbi:hypothetical protein M885DRAFT_506446 [Pelagophyceae sp. CCMP2097]|nr:hypothetical protein M885DRAFT_506446 [Pelagophyceae sp. CCMP2097]|mmetsp:Transcript_1665/g.6091  ORF Transcript_1665/g.6091 Transcript_1665/m.6091 type:complete len:343 (-) Transcript_1665:382-1410(-)
MAASPTEPSSLRSPFDRTVLLTVFWEGTANTILPPTTQIGLFAAACPAHDVSRGFAAGLLDDSKATDFKVTFDGCSVTNGLPGLLFGAGLRDQAAVVAERIHAVLKVRPSVVVNVLGLSRGGIGGIFLAQALATSEAQERIALNMLLFDPVPGDQTWSGFPFTGFYGRDVSDCKCLERVVALYPHEPLPDVAFHAPVLIVYPAACRVEEDVTLGCHQGALFATRYSSHKVHVASNLSFLRIADFLTEVGTRLNLAASFAYQPSAADCLNIYRAALEQEAPTRRTLHDGRGLGRVIVRNRDGQYLNQHHEKLERALERDAPGQDAWAEALAPLPRYMLAITSR